MPLIKQIREAVDDGSLTAPFTVNDLRQWISDRKILKDDGGKYRASSIGAILSNSDIKNRKTTNQHAKVLHSRERSDGLREYWFN